MAVIATSGSAHESKSWGLEKVISKINPWSVKVAADFGNTDVANIGTIEIGSMAYEFCRLYPYQKYSDLSEV